MVKLLRPGRVVVVTAGRFAGKKGVVLSAYDSSKDHTFGHAIIAGVKTPPRKVHKRMDKRRIEQRSRVKVFIKTLNFNHMIPTRYVVASDMDITGYAEQVLSSRKDIDEIKKTMKSARQDEAKTELKEEIFAKKIALRKSLQTLFQNKFMNPINEKTKKPSKEILFLRKKLRF